MKAWRLSLILVIPFLALGVHILYRDYYAQKKTVPKLSNTYWGPELEMANDTSIQHFTINISEKILNKLRQRLDLDNVELVPPLMGIEQQYGMNTRLLKKFVDYWKDRYTWRDREQDLNTLPHYVTQIQGLKIHFVHLKPSPLSNKSRLPLLMLHGWGGSFREFTKIAPFLTSPYAPYKFNFELIIPSLPGFAFSEPTLKPGLGPPQMAVILKNLMLRLKIKKFYVHGGDWGSVIATNMAILFPEHVLGLHSTLCMSNPPITKLKMLVANALPSVFIDFDYAEKIPIYHGNSEKSALKSSYIHIQATRPDTLGVAFKDSPVGWAAYLLEKYSLWTNRNYRIRDDGGLTFRYTFEDLLDTITIYWVTNSITTSMRLLAESVNEVNRDMNLEQFQVHVPTACTRFEFEIYKDPDAVLEGRYTNLHHTSQYPVGGHFPALEIPSILSTDIFSAIKEIRNKNH